MNIVKYRHSDFSSVSACLPSFLSQNCLSRYFLEIYLTTFFGVHQFKNTSAMRVTFFLKTFKIECKLPKWKKACEKVFCFWDNGIWKCCNNLSLLRREYLSSPFNGLTNSHNSSISLKETFSNGIAFQVINESGKGSVVQVSTVFRPVYPVTCWRVLWNKTF